MIHTETAYHVRQKRLTRKGIQYVLLSLLLLAVFLLATGCALWDPSSSLSGETKDAYHFIVKSSTFSNLKSVKVLSGRVIGRNLYCYLVATNRKDSSDSDLYKISSNGYAETIFLSLYSLTESNYCLAEGYLNLDELNHALEMHYDSPLSTIKINLLTGGSSMNSLVVLIVIFVMLSLNGILASKASDIAADKGYEKKFWFHMCFWLGPIAYIIVAGMPDRVMRNHIVQTNKLLTDLLNGQNIAPSGPTDLKQADIGTFLPEL